MTSMYFANVLLFNIELIKKNVAKKATLSKENKREINVWNEEEVNRFLKNAKEDRLFEFFF
ncbi:DNA integration/recombination/inversion protein [Lederbergia citri]|uniref:DNA integration/recombination/inversion protein n=1 Tax=Lederbergia citri TaxID=2833580 RepID=UPI001F175697|nr:DNA integration/recombination/inversion protein [Lederbergia citri]